MLAQVYLKRGCLVPMHRTSEQMTCVLQGEMKFLVGGEEITLRGRGCCIPRAAPGSARTPSTRHLHANRQDWLDHTDDY
jgi:uncharacterized cupin superfamily protein